MKRIIIILAVWILCISLFACGSEQDLPAEPVSFPAANFNNHYWFSGDFWAFDHHVFYLQDGFYNMGVYWSTNGIHQKLFEERDFYSESTGSVRIGNIVVEDHWLYFELFSEQTEMLYRYDLNEGTYAPVCETPTLKQWAIAEDHFIYQVHPANSDEGLSPLWVYDLTDGTSAQVHPNVTEFGIVEGQLRYLTHDDAYTLYRYSPAEDRSTVLGTFHCEWDDSHNVFNFTPDAVVIRNWASEHDRSLMVYTLSSDNTAVYTLPRGIHRMVAYDQYAYAVVYDEKPNMSAAAPAGENGIYRIHLADGSWEVVEPDANDGTDIHVVSDDHIYIIQRKRDLLFRSGHHVYAFDYITGSRKKVTVI